MNKFRVEIVGDDQHPEGGHVVIRLLGLEHPPKRTEFTIESTDPTPDPAERDGWPQGPLKPLGVRQIGKTIEFLVGPDVVESKKLQPGTPVMIGLPSSDLRCQALWPSVRPQRDEIDEQAQTSVPPLPSRSETKRLLQETKELLALPDRPKRIGGRGPSTVAALTNATANDIGSARQAPTDDKGLLQTPQPPIVGPTLPDNKVSSADIAEQLDAYVADTPKSEDPSAAASKPDQAKPPQADKLDWEHRPDQLPQIATGPASDVSDPTKAYVTHPPAEIVTLEKYDEVRRNSERASRRFAALALFIALLASATSVYAVVAREGVLLSALVSRLAFGPAQAGKSDRAGTPAATLYGTLVAGPLSPQGQKASGVDTKAALQRADSELHANGTPTDRREAAFWLKHYLVGTLGDARTLWALTQLGTIYADPSAKTHDYGRARMLWELSASMGDPIALCFLGNLHEFGYGVRADPRAALTWYQRAKLAGGCKSLDQAIARVRQ